MNNLLKSLKQQNLISSNVYELIRPSGTHIPRLYGLPKIHKVGVPIHSIMDITGSPYHSVAKWLVETLKTLHKTITRHSLRDSFEFVDHIKNLNIKDDFMLSMDVSSLFTNVPLMETVEYICEQITQQQIDIGLPVTVIKELLLKCTMNVQFLFNGNLFR